MSETPPDKCPYCDGKLVRESERDIAHWPQWTCGSLFLGDDFRGYNVDRSRKCMVVSYQQELEKQRAETGQVFVLLAAAESRATAAEAECERLKSACRAVLGYAWGRTRGVDVAFDSVVDQCQAVFRTPPEAPKP